MTCDVPSTPEPRTKLGRLDLRRYELDPAERREPSRRALAGRGSNAGQRNRGLRRLNGQHGVPRHLVVQWDELDPGEWFELSARALRRDDVDPWVEGCALRRQHSHQ